MDGDETGQAQAIEGYIDDGFLAWMATWKAQALVAREIEAAMRAHASLSLTWGEVLSRLGAADAGRMTMNELARQVFVSRSGISQVVTAMAKQGLVERQGDPENLRITYAALTDHGRRTLKRSTTTFLAAIREHFGQHIDPEQARTVTEAMNRVTKSLGGESDTPSTAATLDNLYRVVGAEQTSQEPDSTRATKQNQEDRP